MQNGKNKQRFIWIGVFLFVIILAKKLIDNSSTICNQKCQKLEYQKMLDMRQFNKYSLNLSKKLLEIRVNSKQDTIVKLKELFGSQIEKMTLVERMSVDYNKKYRGLYFNDILKGKEFCQLAIIEFKDGQIGYILGKCEYDLMGFTRPYDKFGFELTDKVQYLLPYDQILIEHDSLGRQEFSISPKRTRILDLIEM